MALIINKNDIISVKEYIWSEFKQVSYQCPSIPIYLNIQPISELVFSPLLGKLHISL